MPGPTLRILPLGGATEIGKNMTVYEVDGRILVADCGVKFPEEDQLGVDLLIPDISYLVENRDRVLGFVLTHGHEDHIGALPYVLRQLPVPIWTTRLTLGMIRRKLHEHGLWADTEWHLVEDGERVTAGPFEVEFVHVCHSIPDACALILRTPAGTVVHTGDFKLDQTPRDGRLTDLAALGRAGSEGVLALVTDSTNVDKPGYVASESLVGEALDGVFREARGRIVIATFASNISRMQQVADTAARHGRKLALAGRSMIANADVARELGYLSVEEDLLVRLQDTRTLPAEDVVILTTGSQGEPLAGLTRMAMGDHREVQIQEGDTVVLSSTPIPGNEGTVWKVINNLCRRGAEVIYSGNCPHIHVSGHGNQEELKLMANLVRPRFVVPVHGEFRHQELWRRMAIGLGYEPVVLENGDLLELTADSAQVRERIATGAVIVDGSGVSDVGDVVLRDRWHLSQDGIFVVVCTVDTGTGRIIAGPDCISRGAILTTEEETIYDEARAAVLEYLEGMPEESGRDWSAVRQDIRRQVNKVLQQKTGRRPMVVPMILQI